MHIIRPESKQPLPSHAKKVFSGILFDVYQWEQKQFDGSAATFEKVKRRDTVGVIAITEDKKILLLEQEQPGTIPFIGTPGGIIDPDEDPFVAAQRELLEETGHESAQWELFDAEQPVSKIDWVIFTFIARNCRKTRKINPDAGEKLKLLELNWNEFLLMLDNEAFRDHQLILKVLRMLRQENGETKLRELLFS